MATPAAEHLLKTRGRLPPLERKTCEEEKLEFPMFTRLIPDRSAGQGFTYKYHAHQEDDALNPRDCVFSPAHLPPPCFFFLSSTGSAPSELVLLSN